MKTLSFTAIEVVSLIGVVQCVYLLVHMTFRAGAFGRIIVPFFYFLTLGAAFFFDFARSQLSELMIYYDVVSWGLWALSIPLSVLVVIQMARIRELPSLWSFMILLSVPLAFCFSRYFVGYFNPECIDEWLCPDFFAWLNVSGAVAGALSLLLIWGHRNIFSDILQQKAGKERYWLILSMIVLNIALLSAILIQHDSENLVLIRTVLGIAFVYLVSTSLLRIYPNALSVSYKRPVNQEAVKEDVDIAQRIEGLLALEKIYHEANYSRTDLAQELGVSEASVSRVINAHFGKSFPQLLNEFRIEDSKQLLLDTDETIRTIAEEVGFNSLPSFNRCFKEFVGQSPSSYRSNMIK